jgi:hypothetical protein
MGNEKMSNEGMRFLQSAGDFPCTVTLGEKLPSWELTRWGRDTLRFHPLPRDRYAIRASSRRLLYRGGRESHCFTVLDDGRFEYDLILKKRPESNTAVLLLEGWEQFDFLRQPDRFGPEILRGSYAVYKKEFVLNSTKYHVGTGKLCHIHRPKIIDRRGREVWGNLQIDRGVLTITVPEEWLGEATYPVTVDPVIGSNTVGAYRTFPYMSSSDYAQYRKDLARDPNGTDVADYCDDMKLYIEERIALNRQTTPLALQGTYNACLYAEESWNFPESAAYPMMYSSLNNKPKHILFSNTTRVPIVVSPSKPAKWNKGTITFGTKINAGTDLWFGFIGDYGIGCRFDYGSQYRGVYGYYLYEDWREYYDTVIESIEDDGFADVGGETDYLCDSISGDYNMYPGARFDFRISMYLELPPQNYTRTLTQGVKLTDNRKLAASYKRTTAMNARGVTLLGRNSNYYRKHTGAVAVTGVLNRFRGFFRSITEQAKPTELLTYCRAFLRTIAVTVRPLTHEGRNLSARRTAADYAETGDSTARQRGGDPYPCCGGYYRRLCGKGLCFTPHYPGTGRRMGGSGAFGGLPAGPLHRSGGHGGNEA